MNVIIMWPKLLLADLKKFKKFSVSLTKNNEHLKCQLLEYVCTARSPTEVESGVWIWS